MNLGWVRIYSIKVLHWENLGCKLPRAMVVHKTCQQGSCKPLVWTFKFGSVLVRNQTGDHKIWKQPDKHFTTRLWVLRQKSRAMFWTWYLVSPSHHSANLPKDRWAPLWVGGLVIVLRCCIGRIWVLSSPEQWWCTRHASKVLASHWYEHSNLGPFRSGIELRTDDTNHLFYNFFLSLIFLTAPCCLEGRGGKFSPRIPFFSGAAFSAGLLATLFFCSPLMS